MSQVDVTAVFDAVAVVVIREGTLPSGADEATAEAGGSVVLVGSGLESVDLALLPSAASIVLAPSPWHDRVAAAAHAISTVRIVIVPSSPDGRDLAPRLAAKLQRPLFAGAVGVTQDWVQLSRVGGRLVEEHRLLEPSVVTLIPGLRGSTPLQGQPGVRTHTFAVGDSSGLAGNSVTTIEVLPADAATMDLTEARRIVAGGQGLASAEGFDQLGRVGALIEASLGGTRVASDAGWIPFERQIGTTGVMVNPALYLAFAISGATQHVSGLGSPEHIISVNTDPSCPMMTMANLAIVSDANAVLAELEAKLAGP